MPSPVAYRVNGTPACDRILFPLFSQRTASQPAILLNKSEEQVCAPYKDVGKYSTAFEYERMRITLYEGMRRIVTEWMRRTFLTNGMRSTLADGIRIVSEGDEMNTD